ncbi:SitI3 family protein [Streptomyces sp. NPDC090499]|uniref:SitI3 family protein n=1 Tax=Streptomyces sp. NPDC090499 TaxID=3365965 RepID=UPI00381F9B3E
MAISYSLEMATPLPAEQLGCELISVGKAAGLFDASVTPDLVLGEGAATERGTWTRVRDASPEPWHPVITDLGFTPTVSVTFRFKKQDLSSQDDDMIRLVSGLLERVHGDAVLHFQFESIWLLRRGTDLSLSEDDDLWPSHRLALVFQPYVRATHTFSEE